MSRQARTVRYAPERQAELIRVLAEQGRIEAATAAVALGVTTETVRKDLITLEGQGLLRRVHGGAVPAETISFEPDIASRTEFSNEKNRIARRALELLPDSGSVILDAGTTTARLAELIGSDCALRFYVNALPLALSLVRLPSATVEVLGGTLRRTTVATVGESVTRTLDLVNVDVAFLGTNGISLERGLTTPSTEEAAVKRRMAAAAQRRVLLADHSKIGLIKGVQHAELRDIDVLVTDRLSADQRQRLEDVGVEVLIA
ncbi:DeoR/GlpR family DNA-binding transcription regulator [Enemella sp. A6]|uniref:DeoR/GlpR family DNA-binding transcription regulator n=1 Tax=Enemella sp. A6 TaxID=3440152 RepID=UPI003EBDDAC0